MKKFFAVLAIAGFMAACNNAAESTETPVESAAPAETEAPAVDSTATPAADSTVAPADSTAAAQ